jgi:hypothetical protein
VRQPEIRDEISPRIKCSSLRFKCNGLLYLNRGLPGSAVYDLSTVRHSASQSLVNETIREVLRVAFNLGVKERDAYYPPPDQRLTAARLGMSRGTRDRLRQYANDPRFVASAQQLERVLDMRAGEDELRWSLRLAKRIVHYDDAAVQALTLSDEATADFDENATSGMASFRLKYANSGNTAISVDMEVQCITAKEKDPDDVFSWEKWSVRNFQFRLEPGEEHIVSGVLPWDLGGNGKIARLIIPIKDKDALLSVEPVD